MTLSASNRATALSTCASEALRSFFQILRPSTTPRDRNYLRLWIRRHPGCDPHNRQMYWPVQRRGTPLLTTARAFECSKSRMPATRRQQSGSSTRSSDGYLSGCWSSRRIMALISSPAFMASGSARLPPSLYPTQDASPQWQGRALTSCR